MLCTHLQDCFAADSRFGRNGHATVTTSSGRLYLFRDAVVQENVEDAALGRVEPRKFEG